MHEYGWTIDHAMNVPLAQAFALYAAIDARYGNEAKGPTYADQELIAAIRSAS